MHENLTQLLISWSEINSHSRNLEGLDIMLKSLKQAYAALDLDLSIEELPLEAEQSIDDKGKEIKLGLGKALSIKEHKPEASLKVLLMGHMDTVFPKDCHFQTCKFLSEQVLNGPGVSDLKGGLVIMLKILERFNKCPESSKLALEVFINPDEEIGSPGSTRFFPELAKNNDFALVYEPSLSDGSVAFKRKGAGNFYVVVRGKSAHVGREFDKGASAIASLAEFISEANKLNDENTIVNFGKITGGGPLNVVPEHAQVGINVRIEKREQEQEFSAALETITKKLEQKENIKFEIHGGFNRKPKIPDTKTKDLFALIQDCAKELGQEIKPRNTGGCCDGNNLFEFGLANIDTMGVRGGNIHSDQEFVNLESIEERIDLSVLVLQRLAQKYGN